MRTNLKQRRAVWESGYVNPSLFGVRANNITPMTVAGTNTFIVHAPGSPKALVVDPGPPDAGHIISVLHACEQRNAEVGGVFITHTHADHIAGTDLLLYLIENGLDSVNPDDIPAELDGTRFLPREFGNRAKAEFGRTPIPVYASDLGNCPEGPFAPFAGCPQLEIVALPGHSDDMVGLLMNDEHAILTGDLIFRFWSSVVPYGDGNLADYFASLDKLQHLVRDGAVKEIVPAHGFPIDQPVKAIEGYRAHRRERLAHVRAIVDSGVGFDAPAIVQAEYGDMEDPMLLRATLSIVYAQLEYLAEERGVAFEPDMDLIAMTPAVKGRVFNG